jgi:hypothetical protein
MAPIGKEPVGARLFCADKMPAPGANVVQNSRTAKQRDSGGGGN